MEILEVFIKSIRYALMMYDDMAQPPKGAPGQPAASESMEFYRGCTFSKDYFKNFFKKNDIIVFPAFTSMSTDLEECKQFAVHGGEKHILFQINCPNYNHSNQFRPKCLTAISEFPSEKEFLLNCFSVYKINEVDENYDNGYLLYRMTMLHSQLLL